MTTILFSVLIVGLTGLFAGILLSFADKIFHVPIDEKEEAVRAVLPGNNCGACGYAGCDSAAGAIAKGEAGVNICTVGGDTTAEKIASVMGVDALAVEKQYAFSHCIGCNEVTRTNYKYSGMESCLMASMVPGGGEKSCVYGCLGYGDCMKVCEFGAIHMKDGVAVIDSSKCTACKKCEKACPKQLINMIPEKRKRYIIGCSSNGKGKEVTASCDVGCIACKKCEKVCPTDAVLVTDNLAVIDYAKCIGCGKCMEACPRGCICLLETS